MNPYVKQNSKRLWNSVIRWKEKYYQQQQTFESDSGKKLPVIPVFPLGTQLNADTLTVEAALRFRAPVCEPHVCRCGADVSTLGLNTLACRLSAGGVLKHVELNDVVQGIL